MTIPAGLIIQRAGYALLDEDHTRWTAAEIVDWMNEAARAVITRRPDAGAYTDNLVLIDGTKQLLPNNVYRLIDVIRNMGTGSTPGRPVKRCDRNLLDAADPNWHAADPAAVTRNYIYEDGANPQIYYVHPPAVANNVLEASLARFPAELDSATDDLDMDEGFQEAVLNYVLYRCYSKDSEYADPAKASAFYTAFRTALGESVK